MGKFCEDFRDSLALVVLRKNKERKEVTTYNGYRKKGKSERGKKANERDEFEIISGWDLFIIT